MKNNKYGLSGLDIIKIRILKKRIKYLKNINTLNFIILKSFLHACIIIIKNFA